MKKFEALQGLTHLRYPVVIVSKTGEILKNYGLAFNSGQTLNGNKTPASLYTSDPELIEYMDKSPDNEKNGGFTFREVVSEKPSKSKTQAPKEDTVAVEAAAIEIVEPVAEVTAQEEVAAPTAATSLKSIEDITTNQQAFAFLNAIDQSLQKSKIRTKETILAKAEEMGYSFPNL